MRFVEHLDNNAMAIRYETVTELFGVHPMFVFLPDEALSHRVRTIIIMFVKGFNSY